MKLAPFSPSMGANENKGIYAMLDGFEIAY